MCLLEPLRYNPRTMRKFSAPLIFIGIVLLAALAAWQGVLHGGKEAGTISGTVTIDPTGNLNPPGQTTGSEICQKFSVSNINGTPCTCATNNIYSNGQLVNDQYLTPKTYYCRQM